MEPLGSCKLTELLAEMLEYIPKGTGNTDVFPVFVPPAPPREQCMLSYEDDQLSLTQLAEKADKLWAKHSHNRGTAAAVAEDNHPIMAVRCSSSNSGRPNSSRGRGQRFQRCRSSHGPAQQPATAVAGLDRWACSTTGLCFYFWTFEEQARCEPSCSWGN
jgi:hypothetical protein